MVGLRLYEIPDELLESFIRTDLRAFFRDDAIAHDEAVDSFGFEFRYTTWLDSYKNATYEDIRRRLSICFFADFPELTDYRDYL